ncbi:MAG: hypothetical protein ACYCRH_10140 [Acidiferrobacteraceae bacterium]
MSIIRKLTPVAIAIAALCATPAFAATGASATASNNQSSSVSNSVSASNNTNSATLNNHVLEHASGNVGANNASGLSNQQANDTSIATAGPFSGDAAANVDNSQSQNGNMGQTLSNLTNHATLNNHVLEYATGNIGANNAAGDHNQQANGTAIATTRDEGNDGSTNASANVNTAQSISVGHSLSWSGGHDGAELESRVLEHASGNIGVNNAAGDSNQQGNSLSVANAGEGNASANIGGSQSASVASYSDSSSNTASLEDHVLEYATGNVGANNAAGTNNQQGNALAIAMSDDGLSSATASSSQQLANMGTLYSNGNLNSADLSEHVLEHASGNVGVNNAAGGNNQQLNSLSIANSPSN